MKGHWIAHKAGVPAGETADIGGVIDPGYDSNAWVWESIEIAEITASMGINNPLANWKAWQEIREYFK